MIRQINGTVVSYDKHKLIIDTPTGIGYLVYATGQHTWTRGDSVTIHTHLAVRENALDLYGFSSPAELELFELLLTIPKIGPKSALAILDQASLGLLVECIQQQDEIRLAKLSGLGKKTAEKVVASLKNKLPSHLNSTDAPATSNEYQDAFDTLVTLGYNPNEVRLVLETLEAETTSELVTQALQRL